MKCTYLDLFIVLDQPPFYLELLFFLPPRLPINRISRVPKRRRVLLCKSVTNAGDGQIGGLENKSSNNLVLVVYYQQGRQGEMESILVVSGGELSRENEMPGFSISSVLTGWTAGVTNLIGSGVAGLRTSA